MTQDRKAKLLHDFLQMADAALPQLFCAHLAMFAAKDAQSQVAVQVQALRDQQAELTLQLTKQHLAASLVEQQHQEQQQQHGQQIREHQQQLRKQKTVYERLLADHQTLQQEFSKQKLVMQQLSVRCQLLIDRDISLNAAFNTRQVHPDQDAVWIDSKTGLMWSRINIGQVWQDRQALGKANFIKWTDAKAACKNLRLAGFDDWRLPNIEELKGLIVQRQSGYNAPCGVLYPPNLSRPDDFGWYWSVSSHDYYYGYAWGVNFLGGSSGYDDTNANHYVRAVRNAT